MSSLNKFFEACGIPQYVWKNGQEDSKIEPAEVAEYSATEQAISTWWISNKTKPLYWRIDQLQAGFEELNIGQFFRNMLKRHPQMDPTYHEIQLDLPGNNQTSSTTNSHPPHNVRCNLTVHRLVTPFIIRQPIRRPRLLERVYKPMHTLH